MKLHLPVLHLCLSALLVLPATAFAGPNASAKFLVHLAAPTNKNFCARGVPAGCDQVVTQGSLTPGLYYYAHVLLADGMATAGFSGAAFGIDYDGATESGVDVYSWHLCADTESPSPGWPATGTGNTVAWNAGNCQNSEPEGPGTGVLVTAGYFYMGSYTPDALRLTPPPSGTATVTSCGGIVDVIAPVDSCGYFPFGYAEFGTGPGWNPCDFYRSYVTYCPCQISGPPIVTPGSASNTYFWADPPVNIVEHLGWYVTGNATIVGPAENTLSVQVTAGAPGTFTLHLNATGTHYTQSCTKEVTVDSGVPAAVTTWGRIKSLYR
jgi:hypothetical protein